MPTIVIASLQPGEGRTTTAAALGACLADQGLSVRLLRVRGSEGANEASNDARVLAAVPGCASPGSAVSDEEARAEAEEAGAAGGFCLIEAPAGIPKELAVRLSARVVLVGAKCDAPGARGLVSAAEDLGDALLGVILTRQPERRPSEARAAIEERGLRCLGVLPEDRLLAGPRIQEMADALGASSLVETGEEGEAVEFVMLGPLSADPGQPYFLQHESKAVVNRSSRTDMHLAALATEPDCLILTGGQPPSPNLLDRARGGEATVLLSPEGTARTMEILDGLYLRTRFSGRRKLTRAIELARRFLDLQELTASSS